MKLALALIALPLFAGTPIVDTDVRDAAGRKIAAGKITVCPADAFSSGAWTITKDCITITIVGGIAKADLIPATGDNYYRARWQTSTTWDETWQVPASATPLTLRQLVVALPPQPPIRLNLAQLNIGAASDGTYCVVVAGGVVTGLAPCNGPGGSQFDSYVGLFDASLGLFDAH